MEDLKDKIKKLYLVDIHRTLNPAIRECTLFSRTRLTMYIDYKKSLNKYQRINTIQIDLKEAGAKASLCSKYLHEVKANKIVNVQKSVITVT